MSPTFLFLDTLNQFLQPLGIIAGLLFSGIALRNDARSRRIENQIRIVDGYRNIWSHLVKDPTLARIREMTVDLQHAPITPAEDRLVRFVLQNLFLAFEAQRAGQLGQIGDMEKDVADFLRRPIPRAVWQEVARFQPEPFRRFIEAQL